MTNNTSPNGIGQNPELGPDGTCWDCEDAAPGALARISVGPLALTVAVCEDCDDKLEEEFGPSATGTKDESGSISDSEADR